jgi:hypothetical protein
MGALFAFRCSCCGALHEGSPSIGFDMPHPYAELDAAERAALGELGSDLCTITYPDRRDHFVRVCLEVPIHGHAEPFTWGVWVSLSAANYVLYVDTWDAPDPDARWFGWFSNRLPGYPDTLNLKTLVHPRRGGLRPWLELEPNDHPLARDCREGLSVSRAQALAELALHPADSGRASAD